MLKEIVRRRNGEFSQNEELSAEERSVMNGTPNDFDQKISRLFTHRKVFFRVALFVTQPIDCFSNFGIHVFGSVRTGREGDLTDGVGWWRDQKKIRSEKDQIRLPGGNR